MCMYSGRVHGSPVKYCLQGNGHFGTEKICTAYRGSHAVRASNPFLQTKMDAKRIDPIQLASRLPCKKHFHPSIGQFDSSYWCYKPLFPDFTFRHPLHSFFPAAASTGSMQYR